MQSLRTAARFLGRILQLYRVEAGLREHRAGPKLRVAQRFQRTLIRLEAKPRHLPQSLLGTPWIMPWANGEHCESNLTKRTTWVENSIRPTAVGKKSRIYVGEAGAGQRGAIVYSIIESCRRRGIDPHAYLKDVLTGLPKMTNHQIPEVIPSAWARTHLQLQQQKAS